MRKPHVHDLQFMCMKLYGSEGHRLRGSLLSKLAVLSWCIVMSTLVYRDVYTGVHLVQLSFCVLRY